MSDSVVLDYPPAKLNPNYHGHWGNIQATKRKYHDDCYYLSIRARLRAPDSPVIVARLDIYPPDRRHRDDDNAVSAFKHGRDGVALALGINDVRLRNLPVWHDPDPAYKRGAIVLTLLPDGGVDTKGK